MTGPERIIRKITEAGYEARYVGGCVRDKLLCRVCNDWDIATSALPEQVISLFSRTIPTGIKHGTVTVLECGEKAEVTTFRTEEGYSDGRHPDSVRLGCSLEEDLSRRDFTVNAMAMDADGTVTDLFGGRDDLQKKIIRCVGDPDKRFSEDALRMFRAYRFAAQLGFSIDRETEQAVTRCAEGAAHLSVERITEELRKILMSDRPDILETVIRQGLLCRFGLQTPPKLSLLKKLPADERVRWAMLKVLVPEMDLNVFRLPAKLSGASVRAAARFRFERTRPEWKKLIAEEGWETAEICAGMCGSVSVQEIRESGECVTLQQLAVSGADFPECTGKKVGDMLASSLRMVLENPSKNTRDDILRYLRGGEEIPRGVVDNLQ